MDENHLDVNWRDDQGNTLLHFSVQADDEERVRYLLAKGARVNDNNYKGETPLDHANFGNPKMVKLLLDGIENVNPKPLQLAVLAGSLESVTLILNTPRVSRYLCYEDYRSKTALDYAIEAGYFEIAQVLLQNVAQQNQFLYFKELITQAVRQRKHSIDIILRDNRVDVQGSGSFLLHFAVCLPNTDIADRMIQNGADVNTQDSDGESVLHKAVKYNNSQQVRLLLEHGADVSFDDNYGHNPLHYNAEIYHHYKVDLGLHDPHESQKQIYEIYKLLLSKGANLNQGNHRGTSPFLAALKADNLAIVKLLLENGADIKAVDWSGKTALHYVAQNPNEDVVEFILDQGLDIKSRAKDGSTPLHCSVIGRNLAGCKVFLRRGAVVNSKCLKGQTPLSQSAGTHVFRPNGEIVRLLLEYGASVADGLIEGRSILEFVAEDMDKNDEMRNILMQHMAKLQGLDLPTNESDQRTVKSNPWYHVYYQKCLRELESMKKTIFYNNLFVFNLVSGNDRVISGYARNNELLKAFEEIDCENRFPIYFKSLKARLRTAVNMQRLLAAAAKVVEKLFNFHDPFHVISQKIVDYLREKDLEMLTT